MDPLFERRELTRNVHVESRNLKRNIQSSLLAQLRNKYEGICVAEGYIQPRSIAVVDYSLGRANLIKGGLDYVVKFQADVCFPHPGQVFRAPVTLKSKIGIHAEISPIKVLLPRDLHIGNGEFEDIEEKKEIEFEVIGSRFQQGDETIVVLGKLRSTITPATEGSSLSTEASEPLLAAPIQKGSEGSDKKVVTVEVSATKAAEATTRRKRLRPNEGSKTNESQSEGSAKRED
jgi:DNA-directed RNA polymerase subunit E'/Rpb7